MIKNKLRNIALAAACALAGHVQAAVTSSFGANTAVTSATNTASFDANLSLANNYVENGLSFAFFGEPDNGGCGYAGTDCYNSISQLSTAFSGNYMGTNGNNAYISIRLANGGDFQAIEFAVGSGYQSLFGYWQAFNDGQQTGAGNFTKGTATVLGLADATGIDEVRFYAFQNANKQSDWSAPAIDNVRVSAVSPVPEPANIGMLVAGLAAIAGLRRRQRR